MYDFLQSLGKILFLVLLTVCLPGCLQYHRLLRSEFPQAEDVQDQRSRLAAAYIRSVAVYDLFKTDALFDALLVSPAVKSYCKDGELSINKENNGEKERVVLYLLTELNDGTSALLNEPESLWSLYLEIRGEQIKPCKIQSIAITRPFRSLFGALYTPHKAFYKIIFECTYTLPVALVFTSVNKTVRVTWDGVDQQEREHEDFYWG